MDVSKDSVKSEVIANKDWSCAFCRNYSKNCISCKQKEKEIKNLKSNIAEMEKAMQHLTYELKQNTERCVDLEDRLCREKKLRKRVEKDFDDLKKEMEHNGTSTCSSCHSSETDQRSPRKEDRRKKFTKKVKLQRSKSKDQYGKAKSRKQSFSKSQPVVQNERKSNSDRPKAKTAEEEPSSENRSSANGNKTSGSTKVDHSDNNIDRPTQNVNPNLVRAVDYLMKYTDLGMQSEQDQIDDDLLGDQGKEFDERKDSQPIRINEDHNR